MIPLTERFVSIVKVNGLVSRTEDRKMKILLATIFISIFVGFALGQDPDQDLFMPDNTAEGNGINANAVHLKTLDNWINSKRNLRPAKNSDHDVGKWSDSTDLLGPFFYVAGDFNEDNEKDFGVVLVSKSGKKSFSAAIFNGPFDTKTNRRPSLYVPNFPKNHGLSYFNGNLSVLNLVTVETMFEIVSSGNSYKVKKTE